jgi:hypothetical protein
VTSGEIAMGELTDPVECCPADRPELQALTRTAITTMLSAARPGSDPGLTTHRPGRGDPPGIS